MERRALDDLRDDLFVRSRNAMALTKVPGVGVVILNPCRRVRRGKSTAWAEELRRDHLTAYGPICCWAFWFAFPRTQSQYAFPSNTLGVAGLHSRTAWLLTRGTWLEIRLQQPLAQSPKQSREELQAVCVSTPSFTRGSISGVEDQHISGLTALRDGANRKAGALDPLRNPARGC